MKTLGGGYTCSSCGQYHRTSVMCRCHLTKKETPKLIEATTSPEKPVGTVIPTAEELMLQNNGDDFTHFEEIAELMRSFAQLHVDAAIKAVLQIKDASGHEPYGSYKYNIERCYPKANIK